MVTLGMYSSRQECNLLERSLVADILKHGGVEDSDAMETVTGIYIGASLASLTLLAG